MYGRPFLVSHMPEKPLIPKPAAILRPALERFYKLRPAAFQHINLGTGVYWHPFLGMRAQTAKMLERLSSLVAANRLNSAEGTELLEYVASEFDALPDTDPTTSVGEMSFVRTTSTVAGDILKGTRFFRKANATTQVPILPATYETLADVHFEVGQTVAGPVPIQAVQTGSDSNHPILATSRPGSGAAIPVPPHGVASLSTLFDRTLTVSTFSAAGGSKGVEDEHVRTFAKAFARGQYGPNDAASRLGGLRAPGAGHVLTFDLPATGVAKVLVADESWASSPRWVKSVQQSMYDADYVGFGCKVAFDVVTNLVISVDATVILRDVNYASDTVEIDAAISDAVRSYFDDRQDWNVWKTDMLQSVIGRSHPKIFSCSSVVVRDVNGDAVGEIASPDYTLPQFHYLLAANAMRLTYTGPT